MTTDIDPVDDEPGGPAGAPDDRPARLRAAWIAAVRAHHLVRTGARSRYNSNVTWDGGYDPVARKMYRPVWPKLVHRADEMGADAFELLRALFAAWTAEPAPTPHKIVAPENVARVARARAGAGAHAALALRSETEVFRSAVWAASKALPDPDPRAAYRYAINDLGLALSPLFRYALAVASGSPEQAARWRAPARVQFERCPGAYREHWRHLLPRDLYDPNPAPAGGGPNEPPG